MVPKTLLSTGALPDVLTAELAAGGCTVCIRPMIRTVSCLDAATAGQLRAAAGSTVVLTSAAAVRALATATLAPEHSSWRVCCVGAATAAAASAFFGKAPVLVAPDSRTLAEQLLQSGVQEVLFLCGDRRLDTLPELLRHGGVRITEYIIYRTEAVPQRVDGYYDGILFFSPSAAESFFSVNELNKDTVLFAIGATTAAALALYGGTQIITATNASRQGLVRAVIDYFNT